MPGIDTDGLRAAADLLDSMQTLDSPEDVAVIAGDMRAMLDDLAAAVSRAREASAATMWRAGMSAADIGAALGVSRQRAHVLASAGMRDGWGTATIPSDAGSDPRSEYNAYLEASYLAAETACAGQLVKPQYRSGSAAVDPRRFWWLRGPRPMYAASEELCRHWRTGEHATAGPDGLPLTYTEWLAQTREPHPDTHA